MDVEGQHPAAVALGGSDHGPVRKAERKIRVAANELAHAGEVVWVPKTLIGPGLRVDLPGRAQSIRTREPRFTGSRRASPVL